MKPSKIIQFPVPKASEVKQWEKTMGQRALAWAKEHSLGHLTEEQALIAYAFQGDNFKALQRRIQQYEEQQQKGKQ